MEGNLPIETERQVVNAKLWAVLTELENALPLSQITLEITVCHYRFIVFRPDEGIAHLLAFAGRSLMRFPSTSFLTG